MWNNTKDILFFRDFLMGSKNSILSWTTDQKQPHCYNHGVAVPSLITNDTSQMPSVICHVLDNCTASGQKSKTTIQLRIIIGIHCIIYWSTLIREGGNSKQERYTLLPEKQPQLTPKHHLLPQTAILFCQGGCEETRYSPVKGYLSLGTYSNLLSISNYSFLLPHLGRRMVH